MQMLSAAAQARLHAYLTRATFGLTGEQKQAVWDELEEHVLTRADHLCAFGTPYPQALSQALAELGPPQTVSAGMLKVYLMPKIMILTLLAAVGIGGVVWAQSFMDTPTSRVLPPSQISAILYDGAALCGTAASDYGFPCAHEAVLSMATIREIADAAGLSISVSDGKTDSGAPTKNLDIKTNFDGELSKVSTNGGLQVGDEVYFSAGMIFTSLAGIVPDLQLRASPELGIQASGLWLSLTPDEKANALLFFDELSFDFILALMPEAINDKRASVSPTYGLASIAVPKEAYTVPTELPAGEVVLMVHLIEKNEGFNYQATPAMVGEDGSATFELPQQPKQLVGSTRAVSPDADNLGNALLVRMTNTPLNDLASGIVQPLP